VTRLTCPSYVMLCLNGTDDCSDDCSNDGQNRQNWQNKNMVF